MAGLYSPAMSARTILGAGLRAGLLAGLAGVAPSAAGCFSPIAPVGVPCAPPEAEQRCPSGLVCVAIGGKELCNLEGGGDGDRDGDAVPDAVDDCPDDPNLDQNDEDGDGLGDVCDPCPPFDANDDLDGDGVGDGCDPNPQNPGDQLIMFEGFGGAVPNGWQVSGSFTNAGGQGLATSGENDSTLLTIPSPNVKTIEIRTVTSLDKITAMTDKLGSISVVERLEAGTENAIACQMSGLSDGTEQQLRIFDISAGFIAQTAGHDFGAAELRLRRTNDRYNCRATNPVLEIAADRTFDPVIPRLGLRVRGANARFDWVMVVASP